MKQDGQYKVIEDALELCELVLHLFNNELNKPCFDASALVNHDTHLLTLQNMLAEQGDSADDIATKLIEHLKPTFKKIDNIDFIKLLAFYEALFFQYSGTTEAADFARTSFLTALTVAIQEEFPDKYAQAYLTHSTMVQNGINAASKAQERQHQLSMTYTVVCQAASKLLTEVLKYLIKGGQLCSKEDYIQLETKIQVLFQSKNHSDAVTFYAAEQDFHQSVQKILKKKVSILGHGTPSSSFFFACSSTRHKSPEQSIFDALKNYQQTRLTLPTFIGPPKPGI